MSTIGLPWPGVMAWLVPSESESVKAGAGLPTRVLTSIATLDPPIGPGKPVPLEPSPAPDGRKRTHAPTVIANMTAATPATTTGDRRDVAGAGVRRTRYPALIVRPRRWAKASGSAAGGSALPGTVGAQWTTDS